jgi:ATP-binding cassette subfamily B protein
VSAPAVAGGEPFAAALAASWPLHRLGEAIEALGRRSGLRPGAVEPLQPPAGLLASNPEALEQWVEGAVARLGLESEQRDVPYGELTAFLRRSAPALLRLPGERPRFLAVLRCRSARLELLTPALAVSRVPLEAVRAALAVELEDLLRESLDALLADSDIAPQRRGRARHALLQQHLAHLPVRGCWTLGLAPSAGFFLQLRRQGVVSRFFAFLAMHLAQYLALLLSWSLVGKGALSGLWDTGWLWAWALLLVTMVPLRAAASWWQGSFGLGVVGLLQRRLLFGALRLEPEEVRHEGAGQLLGRVVESQELATVGLAAGFSALAAAVDLAVAAGVLAMGAGGRLLLLLLLGWVGVTVVVGASYYRRRVAWTGLRLEMTHDLVERMVGYRTRLAMEPPERWHDGEDEALQRYLESSQKMDASSVRLHVLLARGWLLLGTAGLTAAMVDGARSVTLLAIGLGGMLLASQALRTLSESVGLLTGAAIAWRQARALFRAAARPTVAGSPDAAPALGTTAREEPASGGDDAGDECSGLPRSGPADLPAPEVATALTGDGGGVAVLEGWDLTFRYRSRSAPVLKECSLRVGPGDRLILDGPSGGGKSTLISLLAGMRLPETGLLLLHGLDRETLGTAGWRRRVALAPQFQENHVLTNTFAFNLLMGRRWPARGEDLQEAMAICDELGLGELLQRMPSGLQQMVGETGWSLSHGERSRLYIARALLQRASLVVLDESFAALDPETLTRCLRCVLKRAPTLLLIAHP